MIWKKRLRRNDIRKTGLPEKIEGSRPTAFMEVFLADIFHGEVTAEKRQLRISDYKLLRSFQVSDRQFPLGTLINDTHATEVWDSMGSGWIVVLSSLTMFNIFVLNEPYRFHHGI